MAIDDEEEEIYDYENWKKRFAQESKEKLEEIRKLVKQDDEPVMLLKEICHILGDTFRTDVSHWVG